MGKKFVSVTNKYLIIFILIVSFCLSFPRHIYAVKEAGSSASISAVIKTENTNDLNELNIKRKVIYEILQKNNSPLVGEVDAFIATCTKYQIDCYLLPSIAGLESSFGKYTHPDSHNPFGWGGGYLMFDSWADCIDAVGYGIRTNYIDKWGVDTIETMAPVYAESKTWAPRVRYFHNRFEELEAEKQLYFSKLAVELK